MLSIKQIEDQYPENLRPFKKNILREYLQYKILEIIFNSSVSEKLSFLGGTALRIVYNNNRFSEDLDFDNFGMSEDDFNILSEEIRKELEKQGYKIEINNVFKGAYRCKIRIPKILFDNSLSNIEEEKIMIQVDTASHNFKYAPGRKLLNKFDVFTQISVTPLDILLSQKIYALLSRKRTKGRDLYDIVFLLSLTIPNYNYLEKKINISNSSDLRNKLLEEIKNIDLKELSRDVEAFLFSPKDSKKIILFEEFLKQAKLD